MLISFHERAVFQGLEELFTADNGYLVNHSSNGFSDVTITFLYPAKVDYDILHATLLTFWINFIMSYSASGVHLEFPHLG